jgi:YegS/Rv2252/BmrU family lipid kinase
MDKRLKILFVVNPVSGYGRQKNIAKYIPQYVDHDRFDVHVEFTCYKGHAKEIAEDAASRGFDYVIAVGGDGTINEVATALVGTDIAMGIIPTGSGNGLARHLRIPIGLRNGLQFLNAAKPVAVDSVIMNGKVFFNVSGIGFDAHIARAFEGMPARGVISYTYAVFREFLAYKEKKFVISCQGKTIERDAMMVSFANSCQFGNNAYIAPGASLKDGKLEVVVIKKPKIYQIPFVLYQLFNNKLESSSLYERYSCEECIVQHEENVAHLDGEPVDTDESIVLEVLPQSLKILM